MHQHLLICWITVQIVIWSPKKTEGINVFKVNVHLVEHSLDIGHHCDGLLSEANQPSCFTNQDPAGAESLGKFHYLGSRPGDAVDTTSSQPVVPMDPWVPFAHAHCQKGCIHEG